MRTKERKEEGEKWGLFQRIVTVVAYMDDILIFAKTLVQLDALTYRVLKQLLAFDLFLKPEKCTFQARSIDYLGLWIKEGRISMGPLKISGIIQWPTPTCVHDVQAFLGFCNFYRRFIRDYSAIARPLFNLTKKDTPFLWRNEQEMAFHALITAFMTAPILLLPDHLKLF
jgi:Reverse transcriptase (RNA-dependent DNA polymerase)